MTGLEKILEQISKDSQLSARQQIDEAEAAAKAMLEAARETAQNKAAQYERESLQKKQDILARALSSAELESRKKLLAAKQRLIAKAVNSAKEKLAALPDEEYFSVLLKLLARYKEPGQMQMSAGDLARLPADFAAKLPTGVSLSTEPANIKNGFLLLSGGTDINCSFEALFDDAADELQDKAASILFPQEG